MTEIPTAPVQERRNAAVTLEAELALKQIAAEFPFEQDRFVAQLAVAYAIADGTSPKRPEKFGPLKGTNWNVATLDPDGSLAALIRITFPDEADAYYTLETLMNVGLLKLGEWLHSNPGARFSDLLEKIG